MLSLLVYGALRNIDVLILGQFRSTQIVGEYAAMSMLAQLIQVAPAALSQTLGPTIARLHAEGNVAALRTTLNGYLRRASLLAAPIFGLVAIFGPALNLAFGNRFHFDRLVALNLSSGYYIGAVLGSLGFSLSMTGKHRLEFSFLALGAGAALAGCYVLGPPFGAHGVSVAISLSYIIINFGRAYVVSRTYHFIPGSVRDIAPPFVSLAVAMTLRFCVEAVFGESIPSEALAVLAYGLVVVAIYWRFLFNSEETAFFRARYIGLADRLGSFMAAK